MHESMQQPSAEDFDKLGKELARQLAGYHPDIQGAAIGNMVLAWLETYPAKDRDRLFGKFIEVVRASIAAKAKADAAHRGH